MSLNFIWQILLCSFEFICHLMLTPYRPIECLSFFLVSQVRTIWHDPLFKGWEEKKAYRWHLQYSGKSGCMQ